MHSHLEYSAGTKLERGAMKVRILCLLISTFLQVFPKNFTIYLDEVKCSVTYPSEIIVGDPFEIEIVASGIDSLTPSSEQKLIVTQLEPTDSIEFLAAKDSHYTKIEKKSDHVSIKFLTPLINANDHRACITLRAKKYGKIRMNAQLILDEDLTDSCTFTLKPLAIPLGVNTLSTEICPGMNKTFDATEGNFGGGLKLVSVTQPQHGTVAIEGNTFTYIPKGGAKAETDSFTYSMADWRGEVKTGEVFIAYKECSTVCDAFEVHPLQITIARGESITSSILRENSGCNLKLTSVGSSTRGGKATINSDTTFTYVAPTKSTVDSDTFSYSVSSTAKNGQPHKKSSTVTVALVSNEKVKVQPLEISNKNTLGKNATSSVSPLRSKAPLTEEIALTEKVDAHFAREEEKVKSTEIQILPPIADERALHPLTDTKVENELLFQQYPEMLQVHPKEDVVCLDQSKECNTLEENTDCNLKLADGTQPVRGGKGSTKSVNSTFIYPAIAMPRAPVVSFQTNKGIRPRDLVRNARARTKTTRSGSLLF